jgi:succinate dehydrogenase/fumarate reductase flavoprotein subunit
MEHQSSRNEKLSRRGFLKGTGAVMAGVAVAGMTGCQPQSTSPESALTNNNSKAFDTVDEHIAPDMRATATLENAEPIPPENPPKEWTAEADIVVVGTGGGGLAAALLAREQGASVIVVEKQNAPGGATQHACLMVNIAGTGRDQEELQFSLPEYPYNRDNFLRWIEPNYQFSIEGDLLGNLAEAGGECMDWLIDHGAELVCRGPYYVPKVVAEGNMHKILAMREYTDKFYKLGEDAGAEYHFRTPCSALIVDQNRVIGIKATGPDGDVYYKANKGVILCSGGMGMNPDMLKKYIPTAYYSAVMGGPMPYHTGECTRMAMGVGADLSGIDSWCAWESEMDNGTGAWTYFWGARQLTQQPWLNIDVHGKRCNFYEWDEFMTGDSVYYQAKEIPFYQAGEDRARVQIQMSRIGHRSYCIFDGKFEDYMWDIADPTPGERRPVTTEDHVPEQNLFNTDWRVEFANAISDGRIKQADTLKELAVELDLDSKVLEEAVARWNDNCAKGEDSGTLYPLSKRFLNPIVEPPFYGAKLGGRIGKTLCGLRVDENLRVLNSQGDVVPGLYANYSTAGGIVGESNYGTSLINTAFLGANFLSWASGYLAAQTAVSD